MKSIMFYILFLGITIMAQTKYPEINSEIENGNYSKAAQLISEKIRNENLSKAEEYDLNFQIEKMQRIRKDFTLRADDVLEYIRKYYPDASKAKLEEWRQDGTLEYKIIDGEIKYFNRSHGNLFRVNKDAKNRKIELEGDDPGEPTNFLSKHIPLVVKKVKENKINRVMPVKMKLNYTLTVDANAVPAGEVIRCWLPFPKETHNRQSDVNLISVNSDEYIIADDKNEQRTLYIEKKSIKNLPTIFNYQFSIKNYNEIFGITADNIKDYDIGSDLYKEFTSERKPHIYFSNSLKQLSDEVVGDETNPYLKAKKIFNWMSKNIPWAGAREYSTIESISEYCLSKKYGDCGIKALTFIALCRYNGIPAKWQSGWMIYPTRLNLHDWTEIYFEGHGWVPVDPDFGMVESGDVAIEYFFLGGIDAFRLIINDDFSQPLFPAKIFPRSETVDFQRGEVEWRAGNLYFDKWDYNLKVDYDFESK